MRSINIHNQKKCFCLKDLRFLVSFGCGGGNQTLPPFYSSQVCLNGNTRRGLTDSNPCYHSPLIIPVDIDNPQNSPIKVRNKGLVTSFPSPQIIGGLLCSADTFVHQNALNRELRVFL